jgi:3-phenylpropionate/trans-cinnamate dioxygenase ferredoxin subunit
VTAWHPIGDLATLERDGRVVARLAGREVGVVRGPDGELYALRNRCPHHGAPLCLGTPAERVAGTPGSYAATGRAVLRCPWHGWEFELATGRCLDEPSLRAARYAVRVEDGQVLVYV